MLWWPSMVRRRGFGWYFTEVRAARREEIRASIRHGVVKINIHTDTQYAFTRGVADHMFKHYDGVLRVDGELGVKQDYLASTWLDKGKESMVARVVEACDILQSSGKTLGRN